MDGRLRRKQMEAKRKEDLEWKRFKNHIETLREIDEEDGTKTMPPPQIVKYFGMIRSPSLSMYSSIIYLLFVVSRSLSFLGFFFSI